VPRPAKAELELRADVSQFKTLFARSSQVAPQLRTNLRRDIRNAAKLIANEIKAAVLEEPRRPSSHSTKHTGLRQNIAAGIGVSILTGNTKIGVSIISSGKNLPESARTLVRAYDRAGGWRHPVFLTGKWVTQYGRPYFASVIAKSSTRVTAVVEKAMAEAAQSLERTE